MHDRLPPAVRLRERDLPRAVEGGRAVPDALGMRARSRLQCDARLRAAEARGRGRDLRSRRRWTDRVRGRSRMRPVVHEMREGDRSGRPPMHARAIRLRRAARLRQRDLPGPRLHPLREVGAPSADPTAPGSLSAGRGEPSLRPRFRVRGYSGGRSSTSRPPREPWTSVQALRPARRPCSSRTASAGGAKAAAKCKATARSRCTSCTPSCT